MFMNEWDIEEAVQIAKTSKIAEEFQPYVIFLADWRAIVNANTDGWPYWAGGTRAARKLMEQTQLLVGHVRQWGAWQGTPKPTVSDFKKALGPIRACAKRQGWKAPELQPVQLRFR